MIEIVIPDQDTSINEENNTLVSLKGATLQLEHSLISLQDWESKWHKPFLESNDKSYEEIVDYIRCMTISPKDIDPKIYHFIPSDEFRKIIDYINDIMTATWFSDSSNLPGMHKGEVVTAEIIYYWMITLNVPSEYRKWHLNQLLTLIKTISIKNAPEKKMGRKEERAQRMALNKARRAKYKSKG